MINVVLVFVGIVVIVGYYPIDYCCCWWPVMTREAVVIDRLYSDDDVDLAYCYCDVLIHCVVVVPLSVILKLLLYCCCYLALTVIVLLWCIMTLYSVNCYYCWLMMMTGIILMMTCCCWPLFDIDGIDIIDCHCDTIVTLLLVVTVHCMIWYYCIVDWYWRWHCWLLMILVSWYYC